MFFRFSNHHMFFKLFFILLLVVSLKLSADPNQSFGSKPFSTPSALASDSADKVRDPHSIIPTSTPTPIQTPTSEIPARRLFPVNESKNPCVNFHEYVCSQVESSFLLREDRSRHMFAFNDSSERLLNIKKDFFKNIKNEKKLTPRGVALKNYYAACMDERAGAKDEKKWAHRFYQEISKLRNLEEWQKYQIESLARGGPSIWHFGPNENTDNPEVYNAYLSLSFMLLPDHSYYENQDLLKDHRQLMIDFFKLMGVKEHIEARVDRLLKFEKDFVKIYPPKEVRRQRYSEKRELPQDQFAKKYPNIQIQNLLKQIPPHLLLNIPFPEALDFYNEQLKTENLQVLKDHLLYSSVADLWDDGDPEFYQKKFKFNQIFFGGPNQRPARDERCTKDVMFTFAKELDEILLPRIFPHFPEDKIHLVVQKIRSSLEAGIEKNQWLSLGAKQEAKSKMQKTKLQIIKPRNDKEWDFRPLVNYSPKHKIENSLKLAQADYIKMLNEIKAPANLDAWHLGPLTVNAYYDFSANKFVMPIGILQYPFFDSEGSLIENLAAVGAVIGHELGHGIDDQGSKYDQKGRLKQWMTMDDLARFSQKTNQLKEQFNKIGLNGELTLGENVADLVGVTFGYEAAFPNGEGTLEDKKKFFISYARTWCAVARPKQIELLLKTDLHAIYWARINEPIKHLNGFYEAYQCKKGDPMYLPENQRLKIW